MEILNNTIEGLTGSSYLYGMYVGCKSGRVKIKNNIIKDIDNGTTRRGILLNVADSILISGNTIQNISATYGIYVGYSKYDTISNNRIKNNEGRFNTGIYLTTSDSCFINKDTVGNCGIGDLRPSDWIVDL